MHGETIKITRTSNFWLCSEIPAMWIRFKPQIRVCSKCGSKTFRCVHPEGMHLETNVCIRSNHDNVYACFTWATLFHPSHSCHGVANDVRNAELSPRLTHGAPSFYANCQAEVPASVRFLDIHFRRRHDLLKPCEKGHLRSVKLVNHLCVAVRGNYSSQLSIRDPNVMNYKKSSSYSTTRLTLKNYAKVMCLLRLINLSLNELLISKR
jgi:hypothetical protein